MWQEKKLKSSEEWLNFIVPIKLTTTAELGEKERKRKKSRRIYRASQNIKIIHVFLESLISVLSLAGSHSPPHLPRMPSKTVLISGSDLGAAQSLIWSYSCVFLPPVSTAIRTSSVLLWELSVTFYLFHRDRVFLVDRVGLICSLYSWWWGFRSSSLATLPLGFFLFFLFLIFFIFF